MAGRLAEKVTIITGAASGQGRVAAVAFAREGALLVLSDLDEAGLATTAALVRDAGGEATTHVGDLTEEAVNRALVDLAVRRYGRLDVMYNNAGRVRFAPIHETTLEDWHFDLANELTVPFLGCKHALRVMLERQAGAIVNVASVSGLYGSVGHGAHAVTKAGVIGLTRQIAVHYGPQGIRCNAIAPSYIEYRPAERRPTESSVHTSTVREYPLGRLARPEDAVQCALYLASDESSFITGQVIIVDGGKTAH